MNGQGWYPYGSRSRVSSLYASFLACFRPYMPFFISMYTHLSLPARSLRLYLAAMSFIMMKMGQCMYSYWSKGVPR